MAIRIPAFAGPTRKKKASKKEVKRKTRAAGQTAFNLARGATVRATRKFKKKGKKK